MPVPCWATSLDPGWMPEVGEVETFSRVSIVILVTSQVSVRWMREREIAQRADRARTGPGAPYSWGLPQPLPTRRRVGRLHSRFIVWPSGSRWFSGHPSQRTTSPIDEAVAALFLGMEPE